MTSTLAGPATVGSGELRPDARAPGLSSLDLLALGALTAVAVLAWVSLALAHVGAHSLPAVLLLTVGLLVAVGLPLLRRAGPVRPDRPGLVVAAACAAVAAALTFPGFSYGVADKDPGGYVSHAVEIARTGDYAFADPLLSAGVPVQLLSPGARFGGIWVKGSMVDGHCGADHAGCEIVPQFYHLWPALLATAYDAGGYRALFLAVPVMGVLSVLCLVALLRRVGDALAAPRRAGPSFGIAAALAGGLLLATNMLQVWQSRFPTTEVLAQALYVGALLGLVVALQAGWRPAAGLAGLFVGVGWLNRADGLLLALLAVGAGAALVATRRWDARAAWFAAGLAVVTPHALRQAYDYAGFYSSANGIPPLRSVVLLTAGCLLLALAMRFVLARPLAAGVRLLLAARPQLVLGVLVCLGAVALLALGFLRPRLFGADLFDYNGRRVRSYDEEILPRLSWFLTAPGFAVMVLGLAVVGLRRWRASVWTAVLPTLLLFPLYAYSARNSTRLLWWTRRYVPTVLPGIVVLMALAIGFGVVWRYRGRAPLRVPAGLALAGLVGVFLTQSLPLRRHDEWSGSLDVTSAIAALSGDRQGIYLWERQPCCTSPYQLFATPVWLERGQVSALLPVDDTRRASLLATYKASFPRSPIFVVAAKDVLPKGVDPAGVAPVSHIVRSLPMWEESDTHRPRRAHEVLVDLTVWRVAGT